MAQKTGKSKKKVIIITIAVILGLIAIFIFFLFKGLSFFGFIRYFIIGAFIVGILFLIVWLAWWIFQTTKPDSLADFKKAVIDACINNAPDFTQRLYFRGNDEWSSRKVGLIKGVCAIKTEPIKKEKIVKDKTSVSGKKTILEILEQPKYLFFIAFRRDNFLSKFFGSTQLFAGLRGDFSHPSSDNIYLNGMTFTPKIFESYFLANHFNKLYMIDETMKATVYRYTLERNLRETSAIVSDLLDISPRHAKEQEKSAVPIVIHGGGSSG